MIKVGRRGLCLVARPWLLGDGMYLILGKERRLPIIETLEKVHPLIVLELLLGRLE
jgi:hypothetical protein